MIDTPVRTKAASENQMPNCSTISCRTARFSVSPSYNRNFCAPSVDAQLLRTGRASAPRGGVPPGVAALTPFFAGA
jgi:hypothetical protein